MIELILYVVVVQTLKPRDGMIVNDLEGACEFYSKGVVISPTDALQRSWTVIPRFQLEHQVTGMFYVCM